VNGQLEKSSTLGQAVVNMLHSYWRQRRTIDSFSATAGLLVRVSSGKAGSPRKHY